MYRCSRKREMSISLKSRGVQCLKSCCGEKTIKKKIPIVEWLPRYRPSEFLLSDIIAGLTVGLTIIPQSIAYANIATLPLQYGLYSSIMGGFIYCILGKTKEMSIGPIAIVSLLTAEHVKRAGPSAAVLLCFLAGCIQFLCGILKLGFLIDFISVPVVSGFSSAVALIIAASQLKGLLGLKFKDDEFIWILYHAGKDIKKCNQWDLILGLASIAILLLLRKINTIKWSKEPTSFRIVAFRKCLWFLAIARNALVVIIAGILAYVLDSNNIKVFTLTGEIKSGLPSLQPPPFGNFNNTNGYVNNIGEYGSSLALVPLVAILELIAIAKVFSKGKSIDASQELIALGICNIAGSFVSSFPVTGAFSRAAVNNSCGVKTPISGVFTGIVVILALSFLSTSFQFIPKASLSAVIIAAIIFVVELKIIPHLWATKKIDLIVLLITFFSCIFLGAEWGILVGIGSSLLVLIYTVSRPRILIINKTIENIDYIFIQPMSLLTFPSVDHLRSHLLKSLKGDHSIPVIFDGLYLTKMDFTVAKCIAEICNDFHKRKQLLIFTNLSKNVIRIIEKMSPSMLRHYSSLADAEMDLQDREKEPIIVEKKAEETNFSGYKNSSGDQNSITGILTSRAQSLDTFEGKGDENHPMNYRETERDDEDKNDIEMKPMNRKEESDTASKESSKND